MKEEKRHEEDGVTGLFLSGLFILAACQSMNLAGAAGAGGANKRVILTEKDNGGSIALAVNDVFPVQLAGNPSTGYIWEADNLDATASAVFPQSLPFNISNQFKVFG